MDWGAVVSIIFFALLGGIVIAILHFRARMHAVRVLQSLTEKGLPIPPELFHKPDTRDEKSRLMARGIILISAGLAAMVFFWAMTSGHFGRPLEDYLWLPFMGVFPLFVGLANLFIGLTQRPHD